MSKLNNIPLRFRDLYAARFEPEGVRVLADAYWRGLLVLTVVVVVWVLAYGVLELFSTLHILAKEQDTSALPPPVLSHSELSAVVQGFDVRAETYESLRSRPPSFSDPSR